MGPSPHGVRRLAAVAFILLVVTPGGGAATVPLDVAAISAAARRGEAVVVREVALADEGAAVLDLEPFTVAGPGTRFVVGPDNRPIPGFDPGSVTLLRGSIAGRPGSRVYLSLSPWGHRGTIQSGAGGRQYELRGAG